MKTKYGTSAGCRSGRRGGSLVDRALPCRLRFAGAPTSISHVHQRDPATPHRHRRLASSAKDGLRRRPRRWGACQRRLLTQRGGDVIRPIHAVCVAACCPPCSRGVGPVSADGGPVGRLCRCRSRSLRVQQSRLGLCEFVCGDRPPVPQVGQLRRARRPCSACCSPRLVRTAGNAWSRCCAWFSAALVHRTPACDQVDQCSQPRYDDEEECPERLTPSRQFVVAEDVRQDRDEEPYPGEQQHEPEDRQQDIPERHDSTPSSTVEHGVVTAPSESQHRRLWTTMPHPGRAIRSRCYSAAFRPVFLAFSSSVRCR